MKLILVLLLLTFSSSLSLEHQQRASKYRPLRGSPSMQVGSDCPAGRADPLNGLRKYRGGYDIENKHYWASAAFTGIYGYAIGTAVLLAGLVLFIVHQVNKTHEKAALGLSPAPSRTLFLVAVVFTTAVALIFCALILAGNKRLHSEARAVERVVLRTANRVTGAIYYVTSQIARVTTTLQPFNSGFASSERLFATRTSLYTEATKIQRKVKQNKRLISSVLKAIYVTPVLITSLTMVVLLAGLGLIFTNPDKLQSMRKCWRWMLSLVTLLLWLLTIFSWFAFGFYLMTYNVVQDTCVALEQFQQDPYDNSLGSVLPCVNLKSANESVRRMREDLSAAIAQANRNISKLRTQLDAWDSDKYMPQICNPFSGPPQFKLTKRCQTGTVTLDHVPEVLKPFECSEQDCVNDEGKRIPHGVYKTILAYSSAATTLIDATPLLESLISCSFVVDAFRVLVDSKCAPARSALHFIWAAYAGLATSSVALLILYGRELYAQSVYVRVSAARTQLSSSAFP